VYPRRWCTRSELCRRSVTPGARWMFGPLARGSRSRHHDVPDVVRVSREDPFKSRHSTRGPNPHAELLLRCRLDEHLPAPELGNGESTRVAIDEEPAGLAKQDPVADVVPFLRPATSDGCRRRLNRRPMRRAMADR